MKITENYGLKKPAETDYYNVEDMNENMDIIDRKLKENENHAENKNNPHEVTKEQIGLGNVNNTADEDKSVKEAESAQKDGNGNVIAETYSKKSNILSTVAECEASTNDEDIAGASALAEMSDSLKNIILNSAYPVGTVYMSTKNTSPATFLGGTWSAISADKYLKTITSGTGGSTGGSTTSGSTTLTINQIPAHTHETTSAYQGGITWNGVNGLQFADTDGLHTNFSSSTGGGQGHTHTINPPYYSVYAWVRTA